MRVPCLGENVTLRRATRSACRVAGRSALFGGVWFSADRGETWVPLDDLGYLRDVPILYLALAVIGVPLAATAAGWLLAGTEPPAIARTVIE